MMLHKDVVAIAMMRARQKYDTIELIISDFDGGFENDDNLLPPPIPPVPKGDSFDGIIGNTPQ